MSCFRKKYTFSFTFEQTLVFFPVLSGDVRFRLSTGTMLLSGVLGECDSDLPAGRGIILLEQSETCFSTGFPFT
jgi:hypothetical protein